MLNVGACRTSQGEKEYVIVPFFVWLELFTNALSKVNGQIKEREQSESRTFFGEVLFYREGEWG